MCDISKDLNTIINIDLEISRLEREKARLSFHITHEMISKNTLEIESSAGTAKIQKKGGKISASNASPEVTALRVALDQEISEYRELNAQEIYDQNVAIIRAKAAINELESNVWVNDIRGKLREAEKTQRDIGMTVDNISAYRLAIAPTHKAKPLDEVDEETANKLISEGKLLKKECGKAITKAAINKFLDEFFKMKYGLKSLDEAWENLKQTHIEKVKS